MSSVRIKSPPTSPSVQHRRDRRQPVPVPLPRACTGQQTCVRCRREGATHQNVGASDARTVQCGCEALKVGWQSTENTVWTLRDWAKKVHKR